ncbi:MAG: SpoVR family protein, partial [Planctomycetes bacterium]|nr:SpoVR family protein [Planctomycetota bacterium]
MRSIATDPELQSIFERVVELAEGMGRTLPEMRFFILDAMEFTSLLEKKVYPVSPVNIWEGKNMTTRKHRIESGQESSLYYEVVQTGNPSYAYLNHTNNAMVQASVMAHVVGHCEFSELNVMQDSDSDRTERVMYSVKKVNLGRWQMGDIYYRDYWNACESIVPLINPNSQYNLANSVETETRISKNVNENHGGSGSAKKSEVFSSTLNDLINPSSTQTAMDEEISSKLRSEILSRRGYKLRAPCQDIFGFLKEFAPCSQAEKSVIDYLYLTHKTHDFVMRTQIMNEGWAMYWEKAIMMELFKERKVKGIIDYSRIFAGVCYPRPFFQRNPYHLGFHMWNHIEDLLKKGKLSIEYYEETDAKKRSDWDKPIDRKPIDVMTHIVQSATDY